MTTCVDPDCERPSLARQLCNRHYARWRRHNLTDIVDPRTMTVDQRFWRHVQRGAPDDCWPWLGGLNYGYGMFREQPDLQARAHVWSYRNAHGDVPDGLLVDHACHNRDVTCAGGTTCLHRRCVNPGHLVAVSAAANVLAGRGLAAVNARKTHCPNDHPYDEANTYRGRGQRKCRVCHRERERERRRAKH